MKPKLPRFYVLSMKNDAPDQSYWLVCDRKHETPDESYSTRREAREACEYYNHREDQANV